MVTPSVLHLSECFCLYLELLWHLTQVLKTSPSFCELLCTEDKLWESPETVTLVGFTINSHSLVLCKLSLHDYMHMDFQIPSDKCFVPVCGLPRPQALYFPYTLSGP